MCIFKTKTPKDTSAEVARQEEQNRQAAVASGRQQIEGLFSQFDGGYFDKIAQSARDYYMPQIDKQYGDARRKSRLGLADAGKLESSSGARLIADVLDTYNQAKSDVEAAAADTANQQRQQINRTKQDLITQNSLSADPSSSAAAARAAADSVAAPTRFDPVSNIFSGFFNSAAQQVANNKIYRSPGPISFSSGGSQRIVR